MSTNRLATEHIHRFTWTGRQEGMERRTRRGRIEDAERTERGWGWMAWRRGCGGEDTDGRTREGKLATEHT